MRPRRHSVVLGVTADQSITLLRGLPGFLREQGWEVHVVSTPGPLLERLAAEEGVTVHGLTMARNPSPLADLRALLKWVALLRTLRPAALMVGTPKAGLLGSLAGFITRVPRRIYVLRGLRLETTRGVARFALASLERMTAAAAHTVLAVSHSLARLYVEERLAPRRKVVVLGEGSSNGVDVQAYALDALPEGALAEAQSRASLRPGIPVIGFVGRLTRDKGLVILMEAAERLHAKGLPLQLLLVGGVDSDDGRAMLTRITESAMNVSAVGHVDDPRPYFHLMDVLCLPTFREGFPNVVLQAAASGKPTVTTRATGAVDSVVDGVTGLLADVGDADSLAAALAIMITGPDQRKAMGEASKHRADQDFDQVGVWARTLMLLTK